MNWWICLKQDYWLIRCNYFKKQLGEKVLQLSFFSSRWFCIKTLECLECYVFSKHLKNILRKNNALLHSALKLLQLLLSRHRRKYFILTYLRSHKNVTFMLYIKSSQVSQKGLRVNLKSTSQSFSGVEAGLF